MPEVTITLRTIDDSTKTTEKVKKNYEGLFPAVEKAGKGIANFASQNATLIGILVATGAAAKAAYGEYQKYAGDVRDLSLASGASAEEASRLLQVLDDFQISAQDVTAATRFMTKQGLTPNLETLARLSDEYKAINDPMAKNEFLLKNLGRAGLQWANALSQGGDALLDMSEGISDNLILTDKQIRQAEQARLGIDAMSDAWQGLKIQAGAAIGSVVANTNNFNNSLEFVREELGLTGREAQMMLHVIESANGPIDSATSSYTAWAEAVQESTPIVEDNTEAIKKAAEALSDTISSQISLIDNMQSAEEQYTEKSKDLTEQRQETEDKLAKLRAQGYWEQGDQIQDTLAKLEDIKQAEADLAAERDKQSLQFISNILAENLARDGWTQAEFDAFAAQQEAWGLWSADTVAKSKAAWEAADHITKSINNIPDGKTIDVVLNAILQGVAAGNVAPSREEAMRQAGAPGYAEGGVSTGSQNGHWELLHGTEAVIPLKSGNIPVQMLSGGQDTQNATTGNDRQQTTEIMLISFAKIVANEMARANKSIFEKVGRR